MNFRLFTFEVGKRWKSNNVKAQGENGNFSGSVSQLAGPVCRRVGEGIEESWSNIMETVRSPLFFLFCSPQMCLEKFVIFVRSLLLLLLDNNAYLSVYLNVWGIQVFYLPCYLLHSWKWNI